MELPKLGSTNMWSRKVFMQNYEDLCRKLGSILVLAQEHRFSDVLVARTVLRVSHQLIRSQKFIFYLCIGFCYGN